MRQVAEVVFELGFMGLSRFGQFVARAIIIRTTFGVGQGGPISENTNRMDLGMTFSAPGYFHERPSQKG
jgi:hypothetical protein